MINEEAIKIINNLPNHKPWEVEALAMAIKALEQQPCEDCISRQAVKEMLMEEWDKYMPIELDINLSFVLEKISELSSVTSIRPNGDWIICRDDNDYCYCQNCKHKFDIDHLKFSWDVYDFPPSCPNCGANMRGKKE